MVAMVDSGCDAERSGAEFRQRLLQATDGLEPYKKYRVPTSPRGRRRVARRPFCAARRATANAATDAAADARPPSAAPDHLPRLHPGVELLGRDEAERERRLAQARAFLVRLLRDLSRLVVADVRVQRGHQHQRTLHQLGRSEEHTSE